MPWMRGALCWCLTAAIAGCAVPTGSFAAAARNGLRTASSSGSALLYVSDWRRGRIYVFTYPDGTRIATIPDDEYPLGLCSDAQGNVWVTNFGASEDQIVEYAHGGTTPIRKLNDPNEEPRGCAVDPLTGNLAVVNGVQGNVVVYPAGGTSPPQIYALGLAYPFACAYDDAGDLFVDGYHLAFGDKFALAELPAGKNLFERVHVDGALGLAANIQWDGQNLAAGNYQVPGLIYVLHVSKRAPRAKLMGTVVLDGPVRPPPEGVQFTIAGGTLIMPFGVRRAVNQIGFWNYPAGGAYTAALGGFGASELYGVTLSVAPTSPR